MSPDLPLIWAGLIALAVLFYVVLDGFDLGVGILFAFARSPAERDTMMAAVAPYWDGNETWLVLGGAGLFAAFPGAYAILMPALYLPVTTMLVALVLRGVAFEFRLQGRRRGKRLWTFAFWFGSLVATLAQGAVVGGFIQGVKARGDAFVGGPLDWASPYSLLMALGLTAGYALLGAAWLMLKADGDLHEKARRWAARAAAAVAVLLAAASVATLLVHPEIAARWGLEGGAIHPAVMARLAVIPALGAVGLAIVGVGLARGSHPAPFFGAIVIFSSGYLGLGVSFFPDIVPYHVNFRQTANTPGALALLLAGFGVMLPIILAYTAFVFWVFRGKVTDDASHH